MSMLEKYIINRLENVEAENEELRAANRTLTDRLENMTGKKMLLVHAEHGRYYFVTEGRAWSLEYEYKFFANENIYVVNLEGTNPDITRIDNERYFLFKEEAEAKAREQAES